jgi:beta-glucosidase
VIFGKYNPSGKLPATIPKDDSQIIPISTDFNNMFEKGGGYRWFDHKNLTPEFAFGYGLSYTNFQYSNLKLNKSKALVGDTINVSFDVKNVGKVAGEEVAQLYLSTGKISPSVAMPKKQLRGFEKLMLRPSETKKITLSLSPEEFYIYNETLEAYLVPDGEYLVQVGGSSDILPLKAKFLLSKSLPKPDLILKNIRTLPVYPKDGDEVIFMASIINNGTAATKLGENHTVKFFVDGKEIASYSSDSASIPVGGMILVSAEAKANEKWIPVKGTINITAKIEAPDDRDLNKANNTINALITVPNGRAIPEEISKIIQK